ncbi:hypothetical protein DAH55_02180 [Sphingomonas koreensis]|uniref:hypothetical protein n=1 Tax=Sphingomonas koreensis TaxID=93064 RepID=UPI000B26C6B6|nr:hypothetical protein [Sphingomonas koreensis]PJI87817.1 hypothetical protein BDW16_1062 [Sphingomonas koreensis]RSU58419.1 hypothetical protein DAH56_15910 [Sphingomonas koreensis]RSU71869.1 hypothetical protein DAH55_02180 [Sphingomonas koreensis]
MNHMARKSKAPGAIGLRRFVSPEQQFDWLEGGLDLFDSGARSEELEQRFKYAARFEKLRRRPQAEVVLDILGRYGRACIPLPRRTERDYWSVSCLPSTSDKPLVRVNASWMELFTLYADGEDVRARFILHLSDFTRDGSPMQDQLDRDFLDSCTATPGDIGWFIPRGADMFGIKVRGGGAIREFMSCPRALRAIRRFNLTHMNRGRNAYQASHSYSVADHMLEA